MVTLSALIAQIASVTYLAVAIGGMMSKTNYKAVADDIFKHPGLTYMTGFLTLIIGFLMVTYHNFWVGDWTVLITIIGWIALIKGITLIAFPGQLEKFSRPLLRGGFAPYVSYVCLILGLVFGYFGFVA